MQRLHDKILKLYHFLATDIWRLKRTDLSGFQKLLIPPLRIISLTIRKFVQDNCALRASALTFYSLLSIVPILALAFGIAKGFGLDQRLQAQLYQRLAGQEAVLGKLITFARTLLENTKGGIIAGIGVAVLFWSALKLLGHIEKAFNEIWKVAPRSFIRRFTDYLTVMIVSPLLVILSSSVTVYITTQVTAITGKLALLKIASPLILLMLKLLPFGIISIVFIMIYLVMPNAQVKIVSGVLGGIFAGALFQIFQGIYINAQVLVAKYNAIYGSFAALPLFLIWLQLSWTIVLLGALFTYAHQHHGKGLMGEKIHTASDLARKVVALTILKHIITCFENGDPPPTLKQIVDSFHLPYILANQSLQTLKASSLVSEVVGSQSGGPAYQPARDIQTLTLSIFMSAWDHQGDDLPPAGRDSDVARIEAVMEQLGTEIENSAANQLVKDL